MRRNYILVYGLEENKDEITDESFASFINVKMDNKLSVNEIDRSHRIGKPSPWKKRPIIVTFVRYNDWRKAFSNKKKLKDSGIYITKSLTRWLPNTSILVVIVRTYRYQFNLQLSETLKTFSQFFIAFLESTLILEHFEKKDEPHSSSIYEVTDSERRAYLNA